MENIIVLSGIGADTAPVGIDIDIAPVLASAYGIVQRLEKSGGISGIVHGERRTIVVGSGTFARAPGVEVVVHKNPRVSDPGVRLSGKKGNGQNSSHEYS